ncbi:MAG TPA: ACP S-malonyltransferase [Opitutales bacterium]|nr:ACP S-malonyltransferase [Opitutales bacterium]
MPTGLLFSGQGAQSVGMGRSLCDSSAAALAVYKKADEALGWSISSLSFNGPAENLTETRVCQPALFVQGLAIVAALEETGRMPQIGAALGLSLGELTALTYAGAFDFADGLRTVAERGRLMQVACEATDGTMVSLVGGSIEDVKAVAAEFDVDVANLNCPGQIVISGDKAKCLAAADAAKASGKFKMVAPLKVAGAYHSRLMQSAGDAFTEYLRTVKISAPRIPVFSNVTGKLVQDPEEIRQNLSLQVTHSVLWEEDMKSATALGITSFIECGPGKVLAGMAKRIDKALAVASVSEWSELEALPKA